MEGRLRTNCGLFEPLVMFFGLTNSPATFQTMMDNIFEDLISEGVVVVYLDDILIFTETLEEHRNVTRRILELLEKHKLYLRPDKCEFEKTTVEYLGVIISHNSVSMDPVKIASVCNVPLHHRSSPRLNPLPRYPQPAPRAKLSVRFSASRYVIVPFFPLSLHVPLCHCSHPFH